ncbi:MAG: precorrin-8X methylmutase [Tissierellia bacterium]|nr:precorrin-8X methylmutase [Tissierellia bacterium]
MYNKNPMGIENESMDIIEGVMHDTFFSEDEKTVVKRMIHTTGDYEYRNLVVFKNDFVNIAMKALKQGGTIFTDTKMAFQGINKKALERVGLEIKYFIDDELTWKLSKEKNTTRSAISAERACEEGIKMFVIGNAPTALFRLMELFEEGKLNPDFIVGVPVGFVGAAQSKEALRKLDIPSVTTVGSKGGSNVAASVINALLYMISPR